MAGSTMLEAARGLTDTITARAADTEASRSVPGELADRIGELGVYRMFVPKSLGGPEVDPLEAFQIVEALSAADGSTGWTSMILNTTFFASWLDPTVARDVLDTKPNSGMAGLFGPLGRAAAAGDGALRLNGRWPFNSGSVHASWFCEGAFVVDDSGAPRVVDPGRPDWRFMFVPAEEVAIHDNWYVSGLRGTASNDVEIRDVLVPEERTASPIFDSAPQDAPHFRWSFFALLSSLMAGFPLGVARRALDEFVVFAGTKSRGPGPLLADTETAAIAVSRCDSALKAARAFMVERIGEAWQQALTGDHLTTDQRVNLKSAALHAMAVGVQAVDTVFALAGGSALFDHNVIQRCWRDINAASHHIYFSDDHKARTGRMLLGRPAEPWMF